MKKILILLFIMVNFAFADYYFEVENSTMVEAYYNVFNAIAAIFNSNDYFNYFSNSFNRNNFIYKLF